MTDISIYDYYKVLDVNTLLRGRIEDLESLLTRVLVAEGSYLPTKLLEDIRKTLKGNGDE